MGYLLYIDALGMQNLYNNKPDVANRVLQKIMGLLGIEWKISVE